MFNVCASATYFCMAAIAIAMPLCAVADDFAGTLKRVQGQVLMRRGSQTLKAVEGIRVNAQDTLETQADGSAGLILHDGTRLSLGPNSALTLQDFIFDPAQGNLSLLIRVLRGVVAYASGKIGQLAPQSVKLETPVGAIGLRGTTLAVSITSPGDAK